MASNNELIIEGVFPELAERPIGDNWYQVLGYHVEYVWIDKTTGFRCPGHTLSDTDDIEVIQKRIWEGVNKGYLFK